MPKRNISEEVVHQLATIGVKQIFGITGDALNPFTDAIRRDKRIQWITVRHEETAAFAAAAQAELSGELAVCAGTVGPGALHLINGLYNAKRDRSPVLAITGQVPREETGSGYFQETDLSKVFDDACVFTQTLRSPKQIPRILLQAIEAAIIKRGVAHIAIPTDIATETVVADAYDFKLNRPQQKPLPTDAELQQVAQMINDSQQVALLIGCGCRGARQAIHDLAATLQAPVAHALKGTEVLAYDDPYSIGGVGHVGTPHGLDVLEKNDLLLMLGTDFPYSSFLPQHGNVIQLDIDATRLGQRCPIKQGLVGDVAATIEKLLPLLQAKSDATVLKSLQKKRDKWQEKTDKQYALSNKKELIHPQSVVLQLSKMAADDAIFVGDVGEITVWVARHLRMRGQQRLIGSFNHGSLGVGLPAAIGAKARYPERQVIALCGDGAFAMLMSDFITAARYQLPIVVVVFNNAKFGFVELEMVAAGMPRFATDLVNPDFAKIAEACGGIGITVKQPDQVEAALAEALAADKPVILDVFVNPEELIIPPEVSPKTAWLFTQGRLKEMFIERDIKALFKH